MINVKEELYKIIDALNNHCVEYAVCGGVAVSIHGHPRATRDIDLLLPIDQLEAARTALATCEYDLEAGIIPFDIGTSTERRIFRVSRAHENDLFAIDLMLVTQVFEKVWNDRETHVVEGHQLNVVSRDGLTSMKELAGRPQDIADIAALNAQKGEK